MKNLSEIKNEVLKNTKSAMEELVKMWIYDNIDEAMEEQHSSLENSILKVIWEIVTQLQTIKWISEENIKLIATKQKLAGLPQKRLYVDTGDDAVNKLLSGYIRVVVGYQYEVLMPIGCWRQTFYTAGRKKAN